MKPTNEFRSTDENFCILGSTVSRLAAVLRWAEENNYHLISVVRNAKEHGCDDTLFSVRLLTRNGPTVCFDAVLKLDVLDRVAVVDRKYLINP